MLGILLLVKLIRNLKKFYAQAATCPGAIIKRVGVYLIVIFLLILIVVILSHPLYHLDDRFLWGTKGKYIFHEGGIFTDAFLNPLRLQLRPKFPLLVPYSEAFVGWCLGEFNDSLVKVIFPLFFISLMLICFSRLRETVPAGYAFLFSIYLIFMPAYYDRIMREGGSIFSGFPDIPLSVYIFSAYVFFEKYLKDGSQAALWLSAPFCSHDVDGQAGRPDFHWCPLHGNISRGCLPSA